MLRPSPGRPRGAAPVLLVALCGVLLAGPTAASAVVGGTRVDPARRPAVVRLAEACTATLIAPRRLLTAGHCVSHVRPGATVVRLGGARYPVSRVARHAGFRYLPAAGVSEPYRDLGLVELDRDVAGVAPIPLARRPVGTGTTALLLGYGTFFADASGNYGVLRSARLRVRDSAACRAGLRGADPTTADQYRHGSMLCARDADGRSPWASGCFGDSGGPLLVRRGGTDQVAGVDSWGVACGDRDGDPEVFTRVAPEWSFLTAADPGWSTRRLPEPPLPDGP